MTTTTHKSTLVEAILPQTGLATFLKQILIVLAGVAVLALAAKIKVPMFPVPITMGTFAVLVIGAAYGPRLGLVTIIGYMIIGLLGFDVFAESSSELNGLTYMMGSTGGYLVGYLLAIMALGFAARRGWDRSVPQMAIALFLGNVLIYVPGLIWLGILYGFSAQIFTWGLTPFLVGDAMKLVLAALLVPAVWNIVDKYRV
jgi:biotin transport system substrate-specific component